MGCVVPAVVKALPMPPGTPDWGSIMGGIGAAIIPALMGGIIGAVMAGDGVVPSGPSITTVNAFGADAVIPGAGTGKPAPSRGDPAATTGPRPAGPSRAAD